MASTIILSDNGASSGSAGLKQTAGNDGVLILQTTTSGGTATNAITIGNNQAVAVGPYTNSSSGTFNGYMQVGSNLQLMSYASGSNTQVQLASNTYYSSGYKAIAGGAGASKLFVGGPGTWELAGSQALTNAGDAITFTPTLGCNALGYTVYLQGGNSNVAGTGITFPASQSASSDANTLDDYEEGTFTPTFSPASGSWTTSSAKGFYTKIGNVVALRMYLTITTVGTGSGVINVSGLPFAGFNPSVGGGNRSAIGVVREDAAVGFMAQIYLDGNATTGGMQATGGGAIGQASGYVYDITVTYCTST